MQGSLVKRQVVSPRVVHSAQAPDRERRHEIGQFFTPDAVADFMASLFEARWRSLHLLDAGAGSGVLSAALVRRLCAAREKPEMIEVTAYEFDESVIDSLNQTLRDCHGECDRAGIRFHSTVHTEDFIASAVPMARGDLFAPGAPRFNAAIVNPPYRKIRSDSPQRLLLRSAGIEAGNLYAAFLALIVKLLADRGELVAITPRSFCNGPYFKPFRTSFLASMSLRRLHLFDSRSAAFRHDAVLQENIILHAVKAAPAPGQVVISSSSGTPDGPIHSRRIAYHRVVSPDDAEQFIHVVPEDRSEMAPAPVEKLPASLPDLGLSVSTGRVVDFRARGSLRQESGTDTVPLIYPCHFNGGLVHWPKLRTRKPNAIVNDERTRDLLLPSGIYVLVKRFTTKEERKRLVACIYDPREIDASAVGFENHLNYFHVNGRGMNWELAKGLAAFLNFSPLDRYFRQFNGHTQVNATDLRCLKYPGRADLEDLGRKIADPDMGQEELDALLRNELFRG